MVVEAQETVSSYEERMIAENKIEPLLKMTCVNVNGSVFYNYNISRKENLEDYLDSTDLTLEKLRRIILNLQLALDEIGTYLIDECHIWLDSQSIFFEKSRDNFKISLCYYPKDMGSVQEQFRKVMECVMKAIPNGDRDFARLVYGAYDLCLKEDYTLSEFLDSRQTEEELQEPVVERINLRDREAITEELSQGDFYNTEDYDFQGDFIEDYSEEAGKKPKGFGQFFSRIKTVLNKKIEFNDDFSEPAEDFIIEPDYEFEERTVLLSETKPVGKLIYDGQENENDFLITKDVFRIGKAKGSDAVLNAPTISQNHAKIVREGDDYYLSDLNSTNSTFINNQELAYHHPVKLNICDKIRFANVSYVFM